MSCNSDIFRVARVLYACEEYKRVETAVQRPSGPAGCCMLTVHDIVTASQVAEWAYCPEAWRLSAIGQ